MIRRPRRARRLHRLAPLVVALLLPGALWDCSDDESPPACSETIDGTYTFWFEATSSNVDCRGAETRADVVVANGTIAFEAYIGTYPLAGSAAEASWTEDWTGAGIRNTATYTFSLDPATCTVSGSGTITKELPGGGTCTGSVTVTGEKRS